jgi:hypothetical protein
MAHRGRASVDLGTVLTAPDGLAAGLDPVEMRALISELEALRWTGRPG